MKKHKMGEIRSQLHSEIRCQKDWKKFFKKLMETPYDEGVFYYIKYHCMVKRRIFPIGVDRVYEGNHGWVRLCNVFPFEGDHSAHVFDDSIEELELFSAIYLEKDKSAYEHWPNQIKNYYDRFDNLHILDVDHYIISATPLGEMPKIKTVKFSSKYQANEIITTNIFPNLENMIIYNSAIRHDNITQHPVYSYCQKNDINLYIGLQEDKLDRIYF